MGEGLRTNDIARRNRRMKKTVQLIFDCVYVYVSVFANQYCRFCLCLYKGKNNYKLIFNCKNKDYKIN